MPDTLAAPSAAWWPPPAPGRVTPADYERLPEGAPFEFWAGTLVHRVTGQEFASLGDAQAHLDRYGMAPAPHYFHQIASRNLFRALDRFVSERGLGEVLYAPLSVVLTAGEVQHVIEPDVLFVSTERLSRMRGGKLHGPPELVAEVLSPSNQRRDLVDKRDLYFAAGVGEYWILDPKMARVDVLVPGAAAYELDQRTQGEARSRVLGGLVVSVPDLFA